MSDNGADFFNTEAEKEGKLFGGEGKAKLFRHKGTVALSCSRVHDDGSVCGVLDDQPGMRVSHDVFGRPVFLCKEHFREYIKADADGKPYRLLGGVLKR